ncbi:4-hydroxy-tetrahydrodipicolinate synthase [Sinimarinibacterium sp. CAU 1509]|uniref:4-hydroxy-tetrahydrodipicolinate synthase n=1 Tax=Sinimarinibacterium sp. CAU 1509 TaxID=2562283 RepID=UPI0010ACF6DF|nr:4-hydroxy-tetrahydrodipicolinate synthase [Sinimarinibacterium sp. CAU 1509]TJY61079.1 4-hydroxy-tetrahydrodipicolinate synthase [Sinimarinibacterium sp. CAU 1509]
MIKGSIVAIVTPMYPDGAIDWDSLLALVEWHVTEGTDAIVAVGTTGESATLDVDEHIDVIRRTVKQVKGRVPVIAGTGANATAEAIELTQMAKDAGADAALLVTPYYNKPPQEGLFRHYKAVADAVALPQILYNVPGRTGCDMLPATVARLAKLPNIVGLKEAKGELSRIRELLDADLGDDFAIYSGDDATACESILMGCHGDISVTANVAPRQMHEMCAAALAGDRVRAERIDQELRALHRDLFVEPNPIPVKWALNEMNKIPAGLRLPLVALDTAHYDTVRAALRTAGVL